MQDDIIKVHKCCMLWDKVHSVVNGNIQVASECNKAWPNSTMFYFQRTTARYCFCFHHQCIYYIIFKYLSLFCLFFPFCVWYQNFKFSLMALWMHLDLTIILTILNTKFSVRTHTDTLSSWMSMVWNHNADKSWQFYTWFQTAAFKWKSRVTASSRARVCQSNFLQLTKHWLCMSVFTCGVNVSTCKCSSPQLACHITGLTD